VLALLALVAFPVFAHAAAVPNYVVPSDETGLERHPVNQPKPQEGHSQPSETPQTVQGSAPSEGNDSEESPEQSHSSPGPTNGNDNSGNGPTSGKPTRVDAELGLSNAEPAAQPAGDVVPATVQSVTAAHHAPAGGSSPVVPILIAVIVLAALSIAVAVYRRRRAGGDLGGPGQHPIRSTPGA
jgi:cobalamin biosynthesis Mg chelatase CobN